MMLMSILNGSFKFFFQHFKFYFHLGVRKAIFPHTGRWIFYTRKKIWLISMINVTIFNMEKINIFKKQVFAT